MVYVSDNSDIADIVANHVCFSLQLARKANTLLYIGFAAFVNGETADFSNFSMIHAMGFPHPDFPGPLDKQRSAQPAFPCFCPAVFFLPPFFPFIHVDHLFQNFFQPTAKYTKKKTNAQKNADFCKFELA
ncbi:MAG: hypothetical protein Q4G00_10075 [Clostridia bacterium]|nr:hypothetical protein [Clostridia bacterium]